MYNLNLVTQDSWRVRIVHYVAKAVGLLVHVEGIPFGTNRIYQRGTIEAQRHAQTAMARGEFKLTAQNSRPAASPPART